MKILIVEDNPENCRELGAVVVSRWGEEVVKIARSRDSAIRALREEDFELIILDRKLPTVDGELDEAVAHGEAVFALIREEIIGAPIRFWTAFPDDEYYSDKMRKVEQEDIWGDGEQPTIDVIGKSRFDLINSEIERVERSLAALQQIEIRQRPGRQVILDEAEKRVLRIAAKRLGGNVIEVAPLKEGYSAAKVLRVAVIRDERQTHLTVAKITSNAELRDELSRYQNLNRLLPGAAPNIVCQVRYGGGRIGGTFYQLAAGHEGSVFGALRQRPESGVALVERVRAKMNSWHRDSRLRTGSVQELRRLVVSNEILEKVKGRLVDIDLDQIEAREVSWMECCCHGDLHGENVLLTPEYDPILIDYGDVGSAPAAIDPITLELSAVFHGSGVAAQLGWPKVSDAENWPNVEEYVRACPYADYVRACRNWAYEVARGNRALLAVAYAYVLRQFKYDDTDKDLAAAMLTSVVRAFLAT